MSTTIRVDDETHHRLQTISRNSGRQLIDVVREATAALELVEFATKVRSELATLRTDTAAWESYMAEAESATVLDGLT